MNLEAFKATRRICADVQEELGFDIGEELPEGLIYADSAYILDNGDQADEGKRYYLNIYHGEWLSDDLAKLERMLWSEYWLGESCPPTYRLDRPNFDQAVLGYCDANEIEAEPARIDRLWQKCMGMAAYEASRHIAAEFRADLARRYSKRIASVEAVCAGQFSA